MQTLKLGLSFDRKFTICLPFWTFSNLIWTTASQYDPTNYILSASRFDIGSDFNLYAYFHSVGNGILTGLAIWTKIPFAFLVSTLLWFATCQVLQVFSKSVSSRILICLGGLIAFFGSNPLVTTQIYSDWSGYFVACLLIRGFFELQRNEKTGRGLIIISLAVGTLFRPEFLFVTSLMFVTILLAVFLKLNWRTLARYTVSTLLASFVFQCSFLYLQTGFIGTSIPTSSQVLKIENLILPYTSSSVDQSHLELNLEGMSEPLLSFSQEMIRINGQSEFRVDLIPLQISTTLFSLYGQNPHEVSIKASNLNGNATIPAYDMYSNGKNFIITDRETHLIKSIQYLPIALNSIFFPPDLNAAWSCDDRLAQVQLFDKIRLGTECPYHSAAKLFRGVDRGISGIFLILGLLGVSRLLLEKNFRNLRLVSIFAGILVGSRVIAFSLVLGIYQSTSTRFLSWIVPCILFFAASFFLRRSAASSKK
jgi:hypothetical protein